MGLCPRPRWQAYIALSGPRLYLKGILLRGGGDGEVGGRDLAHPKMLAWRLPYDQTTQTGLPWI